MSLRSEAVAAHQASQSSRTSEARAALAAVLTPFDVVSLTVEDIEVTDAFTLVVFTDGDIHLGVRARGGNEWTVHLVEDRDGWTELVSVVSLAHLGKVLPEWDPIDENAAPPAPTYAAWVQPTGAHDAYALGARVTHKTKVWESTVNGNVWEPGVSGWREVVA